MKAICWILGVHTKEKQCWINFHAGALQHYNLKNKWTILKYTAGQTKKQATVNAGSKDTRTIVRSKNKRK